MLSETNVVPLRGVIRRVVRCMLFSSKGLRPDSVFLDVRRCVSYFLEKTYKQWQQLVEIYGPAKNKAILTD